MKKNKIIVIVSCTMMVIGLFIYGMGYAMGGRVVGLSFNNHGINLNVSNHQLEIISTEQKEDTLDSFTNIDIAIDYSDITIVPSDHFGISYTTNTYNTGNKNPILDYEVKNNTLYLTTSQYSKVNITVFGTSMMKHIDHIITIYVPEDTELDSLKANIDSGAITCNNFSAKNVDIKAKYGTLDLESMDIVTANLKLPSESGNIKDCSFESLTLRAEYKGLYMENVQVAQETIFDFNSMNFELRNSIFNTLDYNSEYGSLIMKNVNVAGDVTMDSDSLRFDLSNSKFGNFKYKTEYGYIDMDDFTAGDINIKGNSTTMTMYEVTSSKAINVNTEYDTIEMENCNAEDITIKADSTKVGMVGLSSNTLNLNTKYDSVRIENSNIEDMIAKTDSTKVTMTGLLFTNLQMESKYGSIELQPINPLEDYGYDISTKYGKITIGGNKVESSYQTLFNDSLTKSIKIDGDSCDIDIHD